ncbi:hypothetical protein OS493_028872 [Desmophyllum pertusum]|uniref:Core-binding (CB) domain-containing protein n=1 Tax=Desmophyllum pertusum TaxID=174260 RepID=A0A9W9ZKC2_9CNID|nr:hypothetical protein OS493_028872 [Desmophyllum pertusum]
MSCGTCSVENAFKLTFMNYKSQQRGDPEPSMQDLDSCMKNQAPGTPPLTILGFEKGFHGRTLGRPLSPLCASQLQTMVKTADRLGIPLAPDKLEAQTTRLVFLGILNDSNLMECSLPPDKLSKLLTELQAWSSCKKCIKRELLSLIDVPVPPPRPSCRFGIDCSSSLSPDTLAGCLAFLQSQAIAPSTRRAYQAGIRRYTTFCYSRQWDPFPASELQLHYFASWLSDQVSFPTIKLYLAGLGFAHIKNSLTDPLADAPSFIYF